MSSKFPKNQFGFSLVEVSIVTSMIAIFATASLISLHLNLSKAAVSDAESIIVTSLYKARSQAINGYGTTEFGVRIEPKKVTVFAGNYASPLETRNLPELTSTSFTSTDIVFKRLRGTANGDFFITISGPEDVKRIIAVTGQGIISSY